MHLMLVRVSHPEDMSLYICKYCKFPNLKQKTHKKLTHSVQEVNGKVSFVTESECVCVIYHLQQVCPKAVPKCPWALRWETSWETTHSSTHPRKGTPRQTEVRTAPKSNLANYWVFVGVAYKSRMAPKQLHPCTASPAPHAQLKHCGHGQVKALWAWSKHCGRGQSTALRVCEHLEKAKHRMYWNRKL